MKKKEIFSHSLSFLTLKYMYDFFRVLPVTGSDRNPKQTTISTFVYALKVWANILSGAAVIERPDWILEKKNSSNDMSNHAYKPNLSAKE